MILSFCQFLPPMANPDCPVTGQFPLIFILVSRTAASRWIIVWPEPLSSRLPLRKMYNSIGLIAWHRLSTTLQVYLSYDSLSGLLSAWNHCSTSCFCKDFCWAAPVPSPSHGWLLVDFRVLLTNPLWLQGHKTHVTDQRVRAFDVASVWDVPAPLINQVHIISGCAEGIIPFLLFH